MFQNKITTINLFIPLVLKRFFQNIQYKLIYLKIFISFFPFIYFYHILLHTIISINL